MVFLWKLLLQVQILWLQIGSGYPNLKPCVQANLLLRVLVVPILAFGRFSIVSKLSPLSVFSNARLCFEALFSSSLYGSNLSNLSLPR